MNEMARVPNRIPAIGRVYIAAVILLGITAVTVSLLQVRQQFLGYQWYMLAALTLVSGSATVQLPSIPASISVSETFVIASVLLFGPAAGTVMVALDGLVISFWMAKRRPEWYRAVFNMAAPAASIWLASHLLFTFTGIAPLIHQPSSIDRLLLPLLTFAVVYFGLNSWFIAIAVSFETRLTPYRIWRENFLWLSLNYFSGASVALLLVVYTRDVDLKFVGVIVPLLLVLYFTFKTSMQRVEDTNRHLEQLNRLHISTIETLAMAIDAKDQITHGHIRRVQTLAVRLATHVGIVDPLLIRAIEAAALLHDMGKLAVPEYILNKPGKLTPAEFERMKSHAAVGADILAAIDFPYPVTPIVRYHHESWDGTGYPEGLQGIDIPVGARILAVVDCFDALTSDRPYRPRLSDNEAIAILKERRGSMYDPLIVDTFERVHKEIAADLASPQADSPVTKISTSTAPSYSPTAALDDITAGADEMLTLFELSKSLANQVSLSDAADIVAKHLKRLIPFSLFTVYLYDVGANELEIKYSSGVGTSIARGLRIAVGQHLSGWVAANRQSILNSDPSLDFGDVARHFEPRLRSCLSCPLVSDDQLVGVLSLYSDVTDRFNEDHRRILEALARQVAHTLQRVCDFDPQRKGSVLPSDDLLIQMDRLTSNSEDTIMFVISLVDVETLSSIHGTQVLEKLLDHVLGHVQRAMGPDRCVFRCGDQIVAVLPDLGDDGILLVGGRIRDGLRHDPLHLRSGQTVVASISMTTATCPRDRKQLEDILNSARAESIAQIDNGRRPLIH